MRSRHTIDILFPLAVFFAFAATAVMAVLLAANLYSGAVEGSGRMYNQTTALSYIQEKLHQNDAQGAVSIQQLEGITALTLAETHGGQGYRTYIYAWDGSLRELFAREDLPFDPVAGKALLKAESFSCRFLEEGLLEITYGGQEGGQETAYVGLMAKEGGQWES